MIKYYRERLNMRRSIGLDMNCLEKEAVDDYVFLRGKARTTGLRILGRGTYRPRHQVIDASVSRLN